MDFQNELEKAVEKKAFTLHRLDSLSLLVFTMVLVVTVFTVWFFKHRRFRFIHESGLMLVYGLLIGAVLRFSKIGNGASLILDVIPANYSAVLPDDPPDYLRMPINDSSGKVVHLRYSMVESSFKDETDKMERQLNEKMTFSPEIFFNILLPPIIFNAGYSLKKKHFFRNIGSIMMFAFVGTTISCFVVGILMYGMCLLFQFNFSLQELLFFGALISATDPITVLAIFTNIRVESNLFALIFGESVLNDAVAIVLSNTIDKYIPSLGGISATFTLSELVGAIANFFSIFFASFALGSMVGCLSALVTKFIKMAEFPLLETSFFLLVSYASFLLAEVAQMTGIVAVLFCGICQAHYTYNNLSEESKSRTKQLFDVANFLSESLIFSYVGVSMFVSKSHRWNVIFIFISLFVIVVARASHIYPISYLLNRKRRPVIAAKQQHMMLFAAIPFAMAIRNTSTEQRQVIYTATSVIVIVTIIVNGGLTSWMIDILSIGFVPYKAKLLFNCIFCYSCRHEGAEEIQSQFTNDEEPSIEEGHPRSVNPWDKAFLPRKWYNFDANIMKPMLTNAIPSLMETTPDFCLPMARMLTSNEQLLTSQNSSRRTVESNGYQLDENEDRIVNESLSRVRPLEVNASDHFATTTQLNANM